MSRRDVAVEREVRKCRDLLLKLSRVLGKLAERHEGAARVQALADYGSRVLTVEFPILALEELVETTDWHHPCQVLARPRPRYVDLLRLCEKERRRASGARRERLEEVEELLEKAVDLAVTARLRRAHQEELAAILRARRDNG